MNTGIELVAKSISGAEFHVVIDKKPNECPVCHTRIDAVMVSTNRVARPSSDALVQIVYQCPDRDCESIFFATYLSVGKDKTSGKKAYCLDKVEPVKIRERQFSDMIKKVSQSFCDIYNEARSAEEYELHQICGVGYRKALEFLVKDYIISKNPEAAEEVRNKFLSNCIRDHIDNINVKNCAEKAAWLGNDQTHYVQKWEDKDIEDLKTLIELTLRWIETEKLTQKYLKEMSGEKATETP